MRNTIFLITIMSLFLAFSSCEKKNFRPAPVDPNAPVAFKVDIQPLLESKCSVTGCHNGAITPNLSKERSYASLIEGGYVDTLKPDESLLIIKLNTNMPPVKLPASEIAKVRAWIVQGAREN